MKSIESYQIIDGQKDKYIFVLMQNMCDCFMLLFGYFIDDDFDDIIFFGRAEGAVEVECFLLMGLADEIEVGMLWAEGDDEFHFVVEKMEEFVFYCSFLVFPSIYVFFFENENIEVVLEFIIVLDKVEFFEVEIEKLQPLRLRG